MTGTNIFPEFRTGIGFDVHRFDPHRPLILGGVKIRETDGLAGHSDADVALHAICDALLGAARLGDIGKLFPDTDEKYRNVDSKNLLKSVAKELAANNWSVGNLDVVIITESPRISEYSEKMSEVIAGILTVEPEAVSIKGTTSERLGFTGRREGIACMATALIRREISDSAVN